MAEAPYKLWAETQAKWQAEVKADPEIGGTKFQDSVKTAALVFEPGESNPFVRSAEEAQSLKDALNATGRGQQSRNRQDVREDGQSPEGAGRPDGKTC